MDLRRLRNGEWLMVLAAFGAFSSLWLPWFGMDGIFSANGWQVFSVLDLVVTAVAALALCAVWLTAASASPSRPLLAVVVTVWLSAGLALALLVRLIAQPGLDQLIDLYAGAYLGFAWTLALVAGGWWSLADERKDAAPPVDVPARPAPPATGPDGPSPAGPIAPDAP